MFWGGKWEKLFCCLQPVNVGSKRRREVAFEIEIRRVADSSFSVVWERERRELLPFCFQRRKIERKIQRVVVLQRAQKEEQVAASIG